MNWVIVTPELDLPLWWVYEFLGRCEAEFPSFPAMHGLPDNLERARRRSFAKLMCNPEWGLAEWASGNRAPEWLLPSITSVYATLGMEGDMIQ